MPSGHLESELLSLLWAEDLEVPSWKSCSFVSKQHTRKDKGRWIRNCSHCNLFPEARHEVNAASSDVIFRSASLPFLQKRIRAKKGERGRRKKATVRNSEGVGSED